MSPYQRDFRHRQTLGCPHFRQQWADAERGGGTILRFLNQSDPKTGTSGTLADPYSSPFCVRTTLPATIKGEGFQMSIPLDGFEGFFTRLGRIAYSVALHNSYRGSTIGTRADIISDQFNSSQQPVRDLLYQNLAQQRAQMSAWPAYDAQMVRQTLIDMANASNPLSAKTVQVAMTALIAQMVADSDTVQANTVSVSVATGSGNVGDAVCIASVKNAAGINMEYVIPELIVLTATNDSQSGAVTAGYESWSVKSPVAQGDLLSWDWPKGSGVSASITAVPADDGGQQLLTNGDFEDWTVSNTPDNFAILVGSAGTTILRAAVPYRGTYSLSFVGNGSQLTSVAQEFNDSTDGTTYRLLPSTVYALCVSVKVSATPSGGVLAFSLVDSTNAVINNDAGDANTISKDLTTVSTTWVRVSGFFQTPALLPAEPLKLAVRLTTALENAKTVYIDDLTMVAPLPAYAGGPYLAVFPGATATVLGDNFTVTVSNNLAGQLQTWCNRVFSMTSMNMQLPSATSSPSIPDSLFF
jgi:hypothetical protein